MEALAPNKTVHLCHLKPLLLQMVRVLTAHHFASQDIQTCEDPVAVAAVPPDK